jgi:hypothetical protein
MNTATHTPQPGEKIIVTPLSGKRFGMLVDSVEDCGRGYIWITGLRLTVATATPKSGQKGKHVGPHDTFEVVA